MVDHLIERLEWIKMRLMAGYPVHAENEILQLADNIRAERWVDAMMAERDLVKFTSLHAMRWAGHNAMGAWMS